MNIKFLSLISLFLMLFSCKKDQENTDLIAKKGTDSREITAKDISEFRYTDYILDDRTEETIANWNEYKQLQEVVDNVKKGDLSFFDNNKKEVRELLVNLKKNIPPQVNTSAIYARLTALETKLYKLESLSNLSTTSKPELIGILKESLVAFSNLNLQMNKKLEGDHIIIEKP
ncbi:hypothetical protein [Mariniflexile sp.]|uniref:hypothetical protein n=1 Tax=Mariniflexile sp. TaxID=1979402 RepID=UPI004047A347